MEKNNGRVLVTNDNIVSKNILHGFKNAAVSCVNISLRDRVLILTTNQD